MVETNERLSSVIATLEECQGRLSGEGERDAAQLLGIAILELRMRLHQIADSELKALCDAISIEENEKLDLSKSWGRRGS